MRIRRLCEAPFTLRAELRMLMMGQLLLRSFATKQTAYAYM